MEEAGLLRHHRVLVIGPRRMSYWEAGRRVPEGFAAGLCASERGKATLEQYAATLDELDRPQLAVRDPDAANPSPFRSTGLSPRSRRTERAILDFARAAERFAVPEGRIVFTVRVPSRGMRLSRLIADDDPCARRYSRPRIGSTERRNSPVCLDEKTLPRRSNGKDTRFRAVLRVQRSAPDDEEDIARWLDRENSPTAKRLRGARPDRMRLVPKKAGNDRAIGAGPVDVRGGDRLDRHSRIAVKVTRRANPVRRIQVQPLEFSGGTGRPK
jgi:hypothetical protein